MLWKQYNIQLYFQYVFFIFVILQNPYCIAENKLQEALPSTWMQIKLIPHF